MERSVVATKVGGPPEFVPPDAGVLVDPERRRRRSPHALERAAAMPTPNPAAREAAAAARRPGPGGADGGGAGARGGAALGR